MVSRILLISDDAYPGEIARAALEGAGYAVHTTTTGRDGLDCLALRQPDLVVIDLMRVEMGSATTLQELRRRSAVPVLMLSGVDLDGRVGFLDLGADACLGKPTSPRELVATVRALLRRSAGAPPAPDVKSFADGRLQIDSLRHEVRVDGHPCHLTPSEYNLLDALATHPGRAYTRGELAYSACGHEYEGYERTVDAHVKNLRRKIGDDPARPLFVETIRGVGYRLDAEPV